VSLSPIFCVQDRSGTAAQLTLAEVPAHPVVVHDTGIYSGFDYRGVQIDLDFTVGQVLTDTDFGITTITPTGAPGNVMQSGWPKEGVITWLTGDNATSPNTSDVSAMSPANAYATVDFFLQYHASRGNPVPASPTDTIMQAIVNATDFIDQRYRFKGIKLFQFLTDNPIFDPSIAFIDPWIASLGFLGGGPGSDFVGLFTPSFTAQHTEWPRQGVVDYNGDSVYGVPLVVQRATCEAAIRVLNGTQLQPDYDPTVVTSGGVLSSYTNEIGPIRETKTYDTKLGLGFFPSIPQVDRMLRSAGLLLAGGGRSVVL